ncbi:MAG: pitrilysin family protein [Candidatus Omnitrophica bacterium]|nr:pitrilysin family protein [Candidatus Omnitrophota bacterium]
MEVILKRLSIVLSAAILAALLLPQLYGCDRVKKPDTIELAKEAVSEDILENGLVLLTKEIPSQRLAAITVSLAAGSSLEGEWLGSGISHLVEHMLFKGTASRGPGVIEKEIKSYGGFMNGSVGQDITAYTIILPAEYLPQAVSVLKDMFFNASFDPAELDKEKEVILKELRLVDDEPQNILLRTLNKTAYLRHAYKYPPIGYEERFRAITRDDVIKYYNRIYAPNRMVISIVGGIDKNAALSVVEKEFRDFRPPDYAPIGGNIREPAQIEKRYAEKRIQTNLAYLAIGYHSTGVLDEDLFAMDVLSIVLGRGDNSRLNAALLKRDKLVYTVSCWNFTPRDPGMFVITAVLDPKKIDEAEKQIYRQIERVRSGDISKAEIEAAKRMVLGDYIAALETIDAQANDIATNYILTGSADFSRRYVRGVEAVSAKDLKRAAGKYLRDDGATIVRVVPQDLGEAPAAEKAAAVKEAPMKIVKLANGMRIVARQNKNIPAVSITATIGGGLVSEDKRNSGISNFTSRMLLKGTKARKEDRIKGFIEELGGEITPFSGFNGFGVTIGSLKTDIDSSVSLLQDILTNSVFPQDETDNERRLIIALIREENYDIFRRGLDALRSEIFGPSQYGLPFMGSEDSMKTITREDLINYYRTQAVPGNIVISVSGDIEPDIAVKKLAKAFSALKPGNVPVVKFDQTPSEGIIVKTIVLAKEQSFVSLGYRTTDIKDPDRYALEVIGSVLSGYSGRLFDSLRNSLPVSYTLGCVHKETPYTGFFALYAATTKENIAAAEEGFLRQMENMRQESITDEELLLAKRELVTGNAVKMQSNNYFSQSTALDELYGLGYDNIFKYEDGVNKVTKEDVMRAADKYFLSDAYSEVIISGEK